VTVDRAQLMSTCEIVLQTAGQILPPVQKNESSDQRTLVANEINIETVDQWRARLDQNEAMYGVENDLPVEPNWYPVPPIPAPTVGFLRPPVAEDESGSAGSPLPGKTPRPAQEPGLIQRDQLPVGGIQPMVVGREPPKVISIPADARRTAPIVLPTLEELQQAEPIVIMRWLLVKDAAVIAKNALANRGFSPLEIVVARQIVDPDPAVRLEVTKKLTNIAVSDPRPWLLWLSHDIDASVRKATVAILATNPDPILQDRLLELELEETDESVLGVVKQALEQRRRGL